MERLPAIACSGHILTVTTSAFEKCVPQPNSINLVTVHIDLPIFSSPMEPFGWFSGDVELAVVPTKDEPFAWPEKWLGKFPEIFAGQAKQVWGDPVDWPYPPARAHITVYGLVCRDRVEARQLAQHIERSGGIAFDEHVLK